MNVAFVYVGNSIDDTYGQILSSWLPIVEKVSRIVRGKFPSVIAKLADRIVHERGESQNRSQE